MQLTSNKNFLIILAAVLVVAMGIMALSLYKRPTEQQTAFESQIQEIETQSESDDIEEIEQDLMETDFNDIDKELQDIDRELEQSY